MKMRDFMNFVNETDTPVEKKFCLREVECGDGSWVWQYGTMKGEKTLWYAGSFKTSKGAITAATRNMMNPNSPDGISSQYFKDPIVMNRVPITDRSNPFCMD
jgi:hypothetical protein